MLALPFTLSTDTLIILLMVALISIALLCVALFMLERKLRRFTEGSDGKTLEKTILEILAHEKESEQFEREVIRALSILDKRIKGSVRGVATKRFDAFRGDGSGGKQSFASAFLSENGDGVVISSLHAREGSRIFAKPIANFSSEHELTEEERGVIAEARKFANH